MACYRGTVQGARGSASRLGHAQSGGVTVQANAWTIGIRAEAYTCGTCGSDRVAAYVTGGSSPTGRPPATLRESALRSISVCLGCDSTIPVAVTAEEIASVAE